MDSSEIPPHVQRPPAWPIDIWNGAVRGDYTKRMGAPGYLTQGVLGFVPVVGTCCAVRDLMANVGKGDRWGMALNAFALVPVLGGFPKTAHVVRLLQNSTQAYSTTTNVRRARRQNRQLSS
jgi:hypothetical protein